MKHALLFASLAAATMMTSACATTTRGDVREARRDVRDAHRYGDRRDQREAERELRKTKRDYRNDNQCGPRYGRPC
ncbi:putative small secreted protein [Sphingomonas zeicaulis]|uniref:hypothetical protein n=1 Tax=Sphingomonas zeicaulis TaxID=1632740 RepID=UPI003D1B16A6